EEPTVPEVVNVRSEIGKQRRGGVIEIVVDVDSATLLCDKPPPVTAEADHHRIHQPRLGHCLVDKPRRRGCERPHHLHHQVVSKIASAAYSYRECLTTGQSRIWN